MKTGGSGAHRSLSYVAHLRPAWATWEPVSKHESQTKKQVKEASEGLGGMVLQSSCTRNQQARGKTPTLSLIKHMRIKAMRGTTFHPWESLMKLLNTWRQFPGWWIHLGLNTAVGIPRSRKTRVCRDKTEELHHCNICPLGSVTRVTAVQGCPGSWWAGILKKVLSHVISVCGGLGT